MALGTAIYGFLAILLAVRIARQYVDERWAALAAVAVWWASSLPIYMYFNPSWSHAHSAFAVALFLWYWHETRLSPHGFAVVRARCDHWDSCSTFTMPTLCCWSFCSWKRSANTVWCVFGGSPGLDSEFA